MSTLKITVHAPDQSSLTDLERELLARLVDDFLDENFDLRADSVTIRNGTDRTGPST